MTEAGSYIVTPSASTPVVTILLEGYCNQQLIQALKAELERSLQQQKNRVVFDFNQCKVINSIGISVLLETVLAVQEDFCGRVVFTGLSPLLKEVFSFAGIDCLVEQSDSLANAMQLVNS